MLELSLSSFSNCERVFEDLPFHAVLLARERDERRLERADRAREVAARVRCSARVLGRRRRVGAFEGRMPARADVLPGVTRPSRSVRRSECAAADLLDLRLANVLAGGSANEQREAPPSAPIASPRGGGRWRCRKKITANTPQTSTSVPVVHPAAAAHCNRCSKSNTCQGSEREDVELLVADALEVGNARLL